MILGLAGTHRSGKSTLARDVAERAGIGYYDGSFGRLAKTLGYESVSKMDIAERLAMQHRVLDLYEREIRQDAGGRITDRTPLDMIAYLMAEVGMHAGLDEAASRAVVPTAIGASRSRGNCSTPCSYSSRCRSTSSPTASRPETRHTSSTSRC